MKENVCGICGVGTGTKARRCRRCHAEDMRKWRLTHPLSKEDKRKAVARSYLKVYVSRGKVEKGVCEVCGELEVQGHHNDYNKPLEVRWLCKKHHKELHNNQ